MPVATLLVRAACPAGLPRATAAPVSGPSTGVADATPSDEIRLEFVSPTSWHCTDADGCVTCRNLAAGPSDVLLWLDRGRTPEWRRVPPGAGLLICRPPDRTAGTRFAPLRSML